MNLTDLQHEAHAIAVAKGWWDETTTFGDRIERIHGALSEAGKASRAPAFRGDLGWRYVPILDDEDTDRIVGNKPVGVAAELADAVILVADMAEHYDWDLSGWQGEPEPLPMTNPTFGDWISFLHAGLSLAFASLCATLERDEWIEPLKALLREITAMAANYGTDLDAAIQAKLEYYRTRPNRQGGKTL